MTSVQAMHSPAEFEHFRPSLTGHCYRMLGSVFDADDAVQETLVRAWRSMDAFEGRSALSSWLYRIATNVCLDFLAERKRRRRPVDDGPPTKVTPELLEHPEQLEKRPHAEWVEPILDSLVLPDDADPHEKLATRQSTRLAFVSALQHLPGKQRAALLLTEVLGFSAAEAAESLEISVPALNSALQRARATLPRRDEESNSLTVAQTELLERYLQAFEAYDIDALKALLRDDAKHCMPPYSLWLSGAEDIGRWMLGPGHGCRGSRLLPLDVCGLPAFAQYRPKTGGGHTPWALIVLELSGDRIQSVTNFLDAEHLFPRFGLPSELD
jgi:RNA polymerase sigma-70 factor (ECF subfamily)